MRCAIYIYINLYFTYSMFQAGHVCGDGMDLIDGKPTGSIRISFGYCSTLEDALQFLRFVDECFLVTGDHAVSDSVAGSISASGLGSVSDCMSPSTSGTFSDETNSAAAAADEEVSGEELLSITSDARHLIKIIIYPIKSCAAIEVNRSPLLNCTLGYCESLRFRCH